MSYLTNKFINKMNNLELKIKNVFEKLFQISTDKILNAKINNVEKWDSLTHIDLILEIERIFKIKKINNKDIAKLNSFKKIFQYLKKNIK
jgi:acyl carrier protein